MNETVLDTFSALDTTAQLTTITHRDVLSVLGTAAGVQTHSVLDSAAFSGATHDSAAHHVGEVARFAGTTTATRFAAQAVTDTFRTHSTTVEGRYIHHTEGDVFGASDAVTQAVTSSVSETAALASSVVQTALAVQTATESMRVTSRASDGGVSVTSEVFRASGTATDFITRVERVTDLFSVNGSAHDAPLSADVVTDTFAASSSAAATATVTAALGDAFRIYSRVRSPTGAVQATSGWIANTLGMAMSRMVGRFPPCRAGRYAGGTTGLHTLGTATATLDTGSARMSKGAARVRVSNVYCDGMLSNAALTITAEDDMRTPQTYTYDYRGRAGISNGRFDTGKGLTCQRMRLVLTADLIQLDRLRVVGGTSDRRI